jgi:hypothetical protein
MARMSATSARFGSTRGLLLRVSVAPRLAAAGVPSRHLGLLGRGPRPTAGGKPASQSERGRPNHGCSSSLGTMDSRSAAQPASVLRAARASAQTGRHSSCASVCRWPSSKTSASRRSTSSRRRSASSGLATQGAYRAAAKRGHYGHSGPDLAALRDSVTTPGQNRPRGA